MGVKGRETSVNKQFLKCSASQTFRELQSRTALRFPNTPVRMAATKKVYRNKCWRGVWRDLCGALIRVPVVGVSLQTPGTEYGRVFIPQKWMAAVSQNQVFRKRR